MRNVLILLAAIGLSACDLSRNVKPPMECPHPEAIPADLPKVNESVTQPILR
jgi:hypothetical protein